ncbi:MAG: radical SAM family heme chaperone HemW [Nocardioidaceae bacterium]
MPSVLPEGEPVPADGALPPHALAGRATRPLGFYLHVPYCATRCGYCDFNTYTVRELASTPGAVPQTYAATMRSELDLAARVLRRGGQLPQVSTVFFGGGTPTLLTAADLVGTLAAVDEVFGLADGAEVTTEANPDSVDRAYLASLRAGGVNRISFGMQSAVPHVLATLDRTHDPQRLPAVVAAARAAGFESLSLDLIYGTPGESRADWLHSVEAVLALAPDHVSAYALVVEPGTALARRVRRGELAEPEDDDLADKYAAADDVLSAAGYAWYEISNWARGGAHRCRHNERYWTGGDWWGIGPGAHSHIGGVRWWNVKHPAAYAERLAAGRSPAAAREVLDERTRWVERVLLEPRLRTGLDIGVLDQAGQAVVPRLVGDGLAEAVRSDRLVLTRRGRLLADAVVRDLLG